MASSFSNTWGGSGFPAPPKMGAYPKVPKAPHQAGGFAGFITHLGGDIRDFAYGIPAMGVNLGKASWELGHGNTHGFTSMASNMVKSWEYTYGSGNFHTIMHRIYQHPLNPILDAISVATLPLGGAGVAIKSADTLASLGARAGIVSAEGAARVSRLAGHFRPGVEGISRRTIVTRGNPLTYKHYAANPTTRLFQKTFERSGHALARVSPTLFGTTGKIRRMTDQGFAERAIGMQRSRHAVATQTQVTRQARTISRMVKQGLTEQEIGAHLRPAIRQIVYDHAPRVHPLNLLPKSEGYLRPGWTFMTKKDKWPAFPASTKPEDVEKFLNEYGKLLTTTKLKQAARDPAGNYVIVRTKTLDDALQAGASTNAAVHAFLNTPTKVWKWMVLATAPRYFVNNLFGNAMMLAMSADPLTTSRGVFHTIRDMYGNRAAKRSAQGVDRALKEINGDWIDRYHLAATMGFSHDVATEFGGDVGSTFKRLAKGGLYGVTHYTSDTIPRRIAINYLITKHPQYLGRYRAARAAGLSARQAHIATATEISANPAVRDWVAGQVDNILGQYHHYNAVESGIKKLVPFYGWDRAIMRHAWVMATQRPTEAAIFAQMGQQGAQQVKDILGSHIPDFIESSIPLGLLGIAKHDNSRNSILSTTGLNPYAAIPGVTDTVTSLLGLGGRPNEAVAGQVNPLITGVYEYATGTSLLTGAKIKKQPGGLLGNIYLGTAESTPWARLLQTAVQGAPQPKRDAKGNIRSPLLYKGDVRQQLSALLGVPIKEYNPQKAEALWRTQQGLTKPPAYKKVHQPTWAKRKSSLGTPIGVKTSSTGLKRRKGPRKPRKPRLSGNTGLSHLRIGKPHRILPKVKF